MTETQAIQIIERLDTLIQGVEFVRVAVLLVGGFVLCSLATRNWKP